MPKTFQDAIVVAKALDIQYLWIDALNIIQDDEEDWQREAAMMADIYRNAYVVLCATLAAGDSHGFLRPLPGRWPATFVASAMDSDLLDTCVQARHDETSAQSLHRPTHSRAWCFQELLLAKRILSYEERGVYYYCRESELHNMAGYWPAGHGVEEVRAKLSKPLEGHRWINIDEWRVVAKVLGERNETYLGGLWKSHLLWNLLWYTIKPEDPTTLGSGLQRSPSFAWCSVGTVIKHHRFLGPGTEYETLVYITTAACYPKSQVNLHGSVSWGYVALQGTLFTAELSWESSEGRLPYWRVTFIQDLWITPPHMPIPDRALEDSEKFQLAFDVHVVARRDGDKQPYLCRCRTDLDDKPSTTMARATLLLVGSKKPGTSRRLAGPSNGCLYFLILSPSTRLKNIAPRYQTFERLGLYVVKYGPGGVSVLSNRMYQNICLI
ncbi:hypothetical protein LTR42_009412 [Elasticomyces elasticus]|nr:hypothetical protein LTR42_009412 [Elasticomyces elasticus]